MQKIKHTTKECSSFKELLFYTIESSSKDYYEIIGPAIQALHEYGKIGVMCRPFIMFDIVNNLSSKRVEYFLQNPNAYSYELNIYQHYSEYSAKIIRADIVTGKYMYDNGISYQTLDEYSSKMYAAHKSKINKHNIPAKVHHVWLTNPNNPKEISYSDIQNTINTKKTFAQYGKDWEHIIWTNDKTLIKKSVNILEQKGINIVSTENLALPSYFEDIISSLVQCKLFGMASDILRALIIEKEGGVYSDLNFKFNQNIDKLVTKYDFVSMDAQNNFFAAKPHHIILQKYLANIHDDFSDVTCNSLDVHETISSTHYPFVLAMTKYSNKADNIDFYSDYNYFHGVKDTPLGEDNHQTLGGAWRNIDEL